MNAPVVRAFAADYRFYGATIGIVTDNDDPDGLGRVKLRFPWFSEDMKSDWARVAQPYAGNGFGFYWVPELETEVIVSFVQGDIRFPIVTGSLYNGKDSPAYSADSSTDPKVIQTKAGHCIYIEDQAGQEAIEITDLNGNSIAWDCANNTITISALGDIAVEAKGKLTLSGKTGVEISSPSTVTVKGSTIGLN